MADANTTERPAFPPRVPSRQEAADDLLMLWRLERAAGIPADRRLVRDPDGKAVQS